MVLSCNLTHYLQYTLADLQDLYDSTMENFGKTFYLEETQEKTLKTQKKKKTFCQYSVSTPPMPHVGMVSARYSTGSISNPCYIISNIVDSINYRGFSIIL